MNLIFKIFAAFAAVVVIAVITGVMGWRTVTDIDELLNNVITYELVAEKNINDVEVNLQAITVAQRTLLNNSLQPEIRTEQHSGITREQEKLKKLLAETNALLARGENIVEGWPQVRAKWNAIQPAFAEWQKAVDEGVAKLYAW